MQRLVPYSYFCVVQQLVPYCYYYIVQQLVPYSYYSFVQPEVAVSIPDGVIVIFYWHNPSGRNMVLGLTQPLTEMSTSNICWE